MGILDDSFDQIIADAQADQADAASGKSSTRRELEAGVRSQVGQVAGLVGAVTGSKRAIEIADEQKRAAARVASRSTYVQNFDDVESIGDAASYLAHLGLSSVPTIAEMAVGAGVGGVVARGGIAAADLTAAQAARVAVGKIAGSQVATLAPSVGQITEAQRDQSGTTDLRTAIPLGVANNALNLLGVEGIGARGLSALPRGVGNSRITRAVTGALETGAVEAGANVGQQLTEEAGRSSVDETYDMANPDALKRYKESAIGGLALGGAVGGAVAGVRGKPSDATNASKEASTPVDAEPVALLGSNIRAEKAAAPAAEPAAAPNAIDDSFFTGATPETLRPTEGVAGIARALRGDGKPTVGDYALGKKISDALKNQKVLDASSAVDTLEDHVTSREDASPEYLDRMGKKIATARSIIAAYAAKHEELAPGRLASEDKLTPSEPVPKDFDPLQEVAQLEPTPPAPISIDEVRTTIAAKGDKLGRDLATDLHSALEANSPSEVAGVLTRFANKLEDAKLGISVKPDTIARRTQMLARAEDIVAAHKARLDKHGEDIAAFEQLLDEATRPPAGPPNINQLATQAALQPRPGANVTLPPIDNEQSVQQIREQNAAAQSAPPTATSGNQSQFRQSLFDQAVDHVTKTGERNIRGAYLDLLRANYPDDPKAAKINAEDQNKIMAFVQDRAAKAAAEKARVTAEKAFDTIEPPPPETQDTTLGVEEKKPAAKEPATPKEPAAKEPSAPAEPVQGELALTRPPGRTREKVYAREQAASEAAARVRAEALAPLPEPKITRKEQQAQLSFDLRKPVTPAAAKRAEGKLVADARAKLDRTDKALPIDPVEKTRIERLIGDRKLDQANKAIERASLKAIKEKAKADKEAAKAAQEAQAAANEPVAEITPVPEPVRTKGRKTEYDLRETINRRMELEPDKRQYVDPEDAARLHKELDKGTPESLQAVEDELFPSKSRTVAPQERQAQDPNAHSEQYGASEFSTVPAERMQQVQAVVDNITRDWTNAPEIEVLDARNPQSPDAARVVREFLREQLDIYNGQIAGAYDSKSDKVYIFTNGVTSAEDLKGTIFHEGLAHYGLRQAYGKRVGELMDDIYRNSPEVQAKVGDIADPFERRLQTEELLASMVEANPELKLGILDRLKDMFHSFMRRMGWRDPERLSNQDVIRFLKEARESVVNGDPNSPKGGGPELFAKKRQSTPEHQSDRIEHTVERFLGDEIARTRAGQALVRQAVNVADLTRKTRLGFSTGLGMIQKAADYKIKDYKRYYDIQQLQQADARAATKQLDRILARTSGLDSAMVLKINNFLKASTLGQKWVYTPDHDKSIKPDLKDTLTQTLMKQWSELSPEAQKAVKEIFDYGHQSRENLRAAVKAYIEGDAKETLKGKLSASEIKQVNDRKARQLRMFDKVVPALAGPYAPLARWGNHVVVAKSAAFKAFEKRKADLTKEERGQWEELRADPDHYAVFFRDSAGDAHQFKNELAASGKYAETYSSSRTQYYNEIGSSPLLQMHRLKEMFTDKLGDENSGGFSPEVKNRIEHMLKDLYVSTLAEQSARRHDTRRMKVHGADDNMLRALQEKGRQDAHFLAQMKHQLAGDAVMKTMLDSIDNDKSHPQYQERKDFMGEVAARHVSGMQMPDSRGDSILGFSSAYHLALSPKYYLQNATQPLMVTVPWLAGKHGYLKSWAEMTRDYSAVYKNLDADFFHQRKDISTLKGVTGEQSRMLKTMQDRGLLDFGLATEFGRFDATRSAMSAKLEGYHANLRKMSNGVEAVNRITTALAAYNLERSAGKSHEQATAYAEETLGRTQFDYSALNAPRFYNQVNKGVLGRSALQFRKYQLNQIGLFAHMARGIAAGDATAAKQLAYTMAHTLGAAGAVGLPGWQLAAGIAQMLFGGDEPLDTDKYAEDMMTELFGKDAGQLATRGLPTLLGIELSGVGLGNIFNPVPFGDPTKLNTREGVQDYAFRAAGPVVGMGLDASRAYDAFSRGDYVRAATAALPGLPKFALQAYAEATQGVTNKHGDLNLSPDEISSWNTLARLLGFPSTTQLDAQRTQSRMYDAKDYFSGRITNLKDAYTAAFKAGDTAQLAQIRQQWEDMSAAKVRLGLPRSVVGDLLAAPRQQRTRELATQRLLRGSQTPAGSAVQGLGQ